MSTTPRRDEASFEFVRKLVYDYAAIALESDKDYLIESRLMPLARERGLASLRELVAQLRGRPVGDLHTQVVEAMATNETSFFRDLHPFETLKTEVLPRLIAARHATQALTIWSAACSTGQEPYSIAILLAEHFPQLLRWKVHIYATDLSRQVLIQATAGEYAELEVQRGLSAALLGKYFDRFGQGWRIKPEIRRRVRFAQVNLVEPWPPLPTFDIVFLRNVLIYLAAERKRQILANVKQRLARDGVLFLGGAETTLGIDNDWERVGHGKTSTYRLPCRRS